jgi:septum formation protein
MAGFIHNFQNFSDFIGPKTKDGLLTMKVILGSASARRWQILKEMGYDFEIMAADLDERAIRDPNPEKLTMLLANAKADALLPKLKKDAILITSDLVVVFRNKILEKPESKKEAYSVLNAYNREPIKTVCSVVVTNIKTGKRVSGTDIATVNFNPIPKENIEQFIESGEVFDHAGSFAAENPLFAPFVKKIDGSLDSIMGFPKALVEKLIKEVVT